MNVSVSHKLRALALCVSLASLGFVVWLVPLGAAFEDPDEKPASLGLVGLTQGQTLRISIANVVGFDPQPDPPRVCALQVGFVDRENNAIGDPNLFELRPGLARSFDFVAIGDPNVRQYVRPVAVDLRPKEGCAAVISGEILDRGGLNGIIIYDSVAFADPWLSR